jgi:hypothetical protein
MRPVLMVVEHVRRHEPFEMPLIQDDHVVQQVASATSHPALPQHRSAMDCERPCELARFPSSASIFGRSTNQPAIPNRRACAKQEELLLIREGGNLRLYFGPEFAQQPANFTVTMIPAAMTCAMSLPTMHRIPRPAMRRPRNREFWEPPSTVYGRTSES